MIMAYDEEEQPLGYYGEWVEVSSNNTDVDVLNFKSTRLHAIIIESVYPIGSIYMSMNSTDPSALFGGEWVRLKDTFLLASGDVYSADENASTAQHGEADHTLTIDEMPSHTHTQYNVSNFHQNRKGVDGNYNMADVNLPDRQTGSAGGDEPHNNMPPYMAVYMWKRTA